MEELKKLFKQGRKFWLQKKNDEAERVFQKASELALSKDLKNESRFFDTFILFVHRNYRKALEGFTELLSEVNFELKGYTLHYAGYIYAEQKDFGKAIECLEKALKDKSYDTPGDAWSNIGYAYTEKGDYDKAIECLEKALKEKSYDKAGFAWNNMGNAYGYKGENDEAIECYQKALKEGSYGMPGRIWHNIGLAYRDKGDPDKAVEYFKKAKKWAEENDDELVLSKAKLLLSVTKKDAEKGTKSEIQEEVSDFLDQKKAFAEERGLGIPPELEIATIMKGFDTVAGEYSEKPGSGLDNIFAVLKGWSSSIPGFSDTLPERFGGTECFGGGYFIKWKGKGIVIDPGTHFLRNFTSVNSRQSQMLGQSNPDFHVKEIDIVVTTHNHPDHTYDLHMLADQVRQYNRQRKGKKKNITYLLDEDTYKVYKDGLRESHTSRNSPRSIRPETIHQDLKKKFGIELEVFETKHDKYLEHSVGLVISFCEGGEVKYKIGITSDTKYMAAIPKHFKGCDAVVCHFSSLRLEEFLDKKQSPRRLGFLGTRKIIQKTDAPLFLITEFWGGKGDIRFPVIRKLRQEKNDDNKVVIGGDIGLMLGIPSGSIRCTHCGAWKPPADITTPRPSGDYETMRYLCKDCLS